jgi:hypothetical protein
MTGFAAPGVPVARVLTHRECGPHVARRATADVGPGFSPARGSRLSMVQSARKPCVHARERRSGAGFPQGFPQFLLIAPFRSKGT